MDHPLDREIESFLAGRLDAWRRTEVQLHLDACPSCLGRLERIRCLAEPTEARGQGSASDPSTPPNPLADPGRPIETAVPLGTAVLVGPSVDGASPETTALVTPQADIRPTGEIRSAWGRPGLVLSEVTRYEFRDVIGFGGVGVVYRVYDKVLDRELALKVLRDHLRDDPHAQRRLIREAQLTGQLQHPNIVPVHELGQFLPPDHRLYFAMRQVLGQTLAVYLVDPAVRRVADDLSLFLKVCQAVAYAHKKGVIHRDLKPANLMVGAFGEVQVMDWGFAKVLPRRGGPELPSDDDPGSEPLISTDGMTGPVSRRGSIVGTPPYMAPEQALGRNDELDERTDVFGLGAILCEMLTGFPPYRGDSTSSLKAAAAADLSDARARLREYPDADLTEIVLRCLSPEREHRYADAGALAAAIGQYAIRREERQERERQEAERRLRRERVRRIRTAVGTAVLAAAVVASVFWKRDRDALERTRLLASDELTRGRSLLETGRYDESLRLLEGLEAALGNDRRLADFWARADEIRDRAQLLRDARRSSEARDAKERAWYLEFARLREGALLALAISRDEDPVQSTSEVAERVRLALSAVAYRDDATWDLSAATGPVFSEERRDDVRRSVLALLLILADSESQATSGSVSNRALRALAQADSLSGGASSRACKRLRARLEAHTGPEIDPVAVEAGGPPDQYDDYLVGYLDYRYGSPESAVLNLKIAQRNQPVPQAWSRLLLAKCYLRLGRPVEAMAELDDCLKSRPDLAWGFALRGMARTESARKSLREGPAARERVRSLIRGAESDYGQALKLTDDPRHRAVLLYNRYVLRTLPGHTTDLDLAGRDLEEAVLLGGRFWIKPRLDLARFLARRDQRKRAEDCLAKAIDQYPKSALPYRERALLTLARRPMTRTEEDRVLDDLEEAVRREGKCSLRARDLVLQARLLSDRHDYPAAVQICDRALQDSPGDLDASIVRIDTLLLAGRLKEADEACGRTLATVPAREREGAELHLLHALTRQKLGDFPGAIESYTSALALEPNWALVRLRRGLAYLLVNSPRMAQQDFEEALNGGVPAARVYFGLAAAGAGLGHYREAIEYAEKALAAESPPVPQTLYWVARTYAQASDLIKDIRAVRRHLDRAQELLMEVAASQVPEVRRLLWQHVDRDPALESLRKRRGYPEWYRRASGMAPTTHSTPDRKKTSSHQTAEKARDTSPFTALVGGMPGKSADRRLEDTFLGEFRSSVVSGE